MNLFFYLTILFLVLFGIYGYRRGLIRMAYSVAAFLISIAAMVIFAPFFAAQVREFEPLTSHIQEPAQQMLQQKLNEGGNLDEILKNYTHLTHGISEMPTLSTEELTYEASVYITDYICEIIAYVLLFFLIRIVLSVLAKTLNVFARLPVINCMNRLGGLALGLVEALGCLWILFMIIDAFSANEFGMHLLEMIHENKFLNELYRQNLFMRFFKF